MSDGLYKSLEEARGSDQVNKEIAQMAVEQVIIMYRIPNGMKCIRYTVSLNYSSVYKYKLLNVTP